MAAAALPAPTTTVRPAGGEGRPGGTTVSGAAESTAASNSRRSSGRGSSGPVPDRGGRLSRRRSPPRRPRRSPQVRRPQVRRRRSLVGRPSAAALTMLGAARGGSGDRNGATSPVQTGQPESTPITLAAASVAMPRRVQPVAEPMWGTATTLSSSSRPGASRGSCSNTSSAAENPGWLRQCATSAASSIRGAARRVDEDGVRLHLREPAGVDHVPRGVVERQVQAHDVGRAEQLLERRRPAADHRLLATARQESP